MHRSLLTLVAITSLTSHVLAADQRPRDVDALARSSERVVVATVTRVEPVFARNEFGDELIVSRAHLRVDQVLKAGAETSADLIVEVEGGTIGELTLDVSDMPKVHLGERAVFFLGRNSRGANVPHGRGDGILKLDAGDRVQSSDLTLADVQSAVRRSR